MDITMIVLRLFHIVAGVFWVGAALMVFFVVLPFTQSVGEEGLRFAQRLLSQSKYGVYMSLAAPLNVLSGVLMYWSVSNGFRLAWLATPSGVVLTIGSLTGICAFVVGMAVHNPTSVRLAALGKEIAAAGGKPTPEQAQILGKLQSRIARAGVWSMIFMIASVIGMAVARYV